MSLQTSSLSSRKLLGIALLLLAATALPFFLSNFSTHIKVKTINQQPVST